MTDSSFASCVVVLTSSSLHWNTNDDTNDNNSGNNNNNRYQNHHHHHRRRHRCLALLNIPIRNEDFHTYNTISEINAGNARFHAQLQFDLLSFDQNFLSFENSLF